MMNRARSRRSAPSIRRRSSSRAISLPTGKTRSTRPSDASTATRSATASTPCAATTTRYRGQTYELGDREIVLPGVRVLLLDTVIPFETTGRITQRPARVARRPRGHERSARHGDGPPPAVESRLRKAQPHLLRHQPRRLRRPGRRDPTAARHPRLLRRAHPSQPRAPLQRHRRRSRTSRSPA